MTRVIASLLMLFWAGSCIAKPADELAGMASGKRVLAYLAAFNSGKEAEMRAFITENISTQALIQRGVDDRLSAYRRMREEIKHLELIRVLKSEPDLLSVLARTQDADWLQLSFMHEPESPFKLIGIRVEHADGDEGGVSKPALAEQSALDSISAMLQDQTDADSFSGAVLIAKNGMPLLRKAYGWADQDFKVANTPDTKFNLGSISKSFTRVAIERLIAEGKLAAGDTLGKFLPDYPNADARHKVTVQHLLDHRGGISDFFGEEFVNKAKDQVRSLQDYLPLFAAKPLEFEPGSQEQYSNGGFLVLGLIIEKVTGKSYYDYVSEVVFQPAGMKDSGWYDSDQIVANRAIGYTHRWTTEDTDSPELRSNVLMQPARGSSAGGSYSTADDLLKFATALQNGTLHSSEGGQMGIAGGSPGVNAALETGLPNGYAVIVLCNLDPPIAERTARLIRSYLGRIKA